MPEQLLAAVKAALADKGTPDWTSPPASCIIELIERVQKLAKLAENVLENVQDARDDVQRKVEALHNEKTSIKRTA